jgi:hypothetical protein
MFTFPRLCLVRFDDYKQKDEDVNASVASFPFHLRVGDMWRILVVHSILCLKL